MIERILKKFGYLLVKASEYEDSLELAKQKIEWTISKQNLLNQLIAARSKLETYQKEKVGIGIEVGDPVPKDRAERQMYVAKVAGLHKDVLEPKLKHMIQRAHVLLEETGSARDYDLELKGAVYAFREILRWGEAMLNEQVANQIESSKMTNEETKIY